MMTIASEKLLDDAAKSCCTSYGDILHEELAMSKADATLLLSAAGNLKSLPSCASVEKRRVWN